MLALTVLDLQKGLVQWISENPRANVPSPGILDGRWGEQTETSFARWLTASGIQGTLVSGEVYAIYQDRRGIEVADIIYWTLRPFIERGGGTLQPPGSSSAPRVVGSKLPDNPVYAAVEGELRTFGIVAIVAAVGAFAAGVWSLRKRGRRR